MNLLTNILLWSSSLTLAVVGISFGIVASINATRANQRIQELVTFSFVSEEGNKLFFTNLKGLILENKKALKKLKNANLLYLDYSISASLSRMFPISSRLRDSLEKTEFKHIAQVYIESKERFEHDFKQIVLDLNDLRTSKKVTKGVKEKLVVYHKQVIKETSELVRWYAILTGMTTEANFSD